MGYAGGTIRNPSYHNIGDYSETVQIDFDPQQISYTELLDTFWKGHSPVYEPISTQYKSAIFYHNEEQKRLAEEGKEQQAACRKTTIYTEVYPAGQFYLAEDYHQKYMLSRFPDILKEYKTIYPDLKDFINSTAVARVNGYLGGHMTVTELKKQLDDLGLSEAGKQRLIRAAGKEREYAGFTCGP